ncbi:MAG: hypothetical protein J3Q66DRAFT_414869 [Benniella sp.]|nr:MAG: hypothetical protein J3Q66DRAFT_414869 [Benniella sp.]
MPNLLGKYKARTGIVTDDMAAALLSGSRNGWQVVRVFSYARIGTNTMETLRAHFATLQVLEIRGKDISSNELIEVLRSCSNLHTLSITDMNYDAANGRSFSAEIFIDQFHETETMKPWKCEASLRAADSRDLLCGNHRLCSPLTDLCLIPFGGSNRILKRLYDAATEWAYCRVIDSVNSAFSTVTIKLFEEIGNLYLDDPCGGRNTGTLLCTMAPHLVQKMSAFSATCLNVIDKGKIEDS